MASTRKLSSDEVNALIDGLGAETNAFELPMTIVPSAGDASESLARFEIQFYPSCLAKY